MKIIGLLIAVLLTSLIIVWWINLSLNSVDKAVNTTQRLDGNQDTETQTGSGPIDYSKQKVKEFNEMSEDRAKEINQLP